MDWSSCPVGLRRGGNCNLDKAPEFQFGSREGKVCGSLSLLKELQRLVEAVWRRASNLGGDQGQSRIKSTSKRAPCWIPVSEGNSSLGTKVMCITVGFISSFGVENKNGQ